MDERFMNKLWSAMPKEPGSGWTRTIEESKWIESLLSEEPLFDALVGRKATHYLIMTEDHGIEVLADSAPEIVMRDPASIEATKL